MLLLSFILFCSIGDAASPFRHAREVFLDPQYPAVISKVDFPPSRAKIDSPLITPNWKLISPDYTRFEEFNHEPAVVKEFQDVIVYRQWDTTYIHGPNIWTASERCYQGVTQPLLPLYSTFSIHEAILVSSQIWGEVYFHYMTEKAFMIAGARELLESRPGMLILVEDAPPRLLEFFELLGVKNRVIVYLGPVSIQKLHMPYYSQCGYTSSANLLLTRKWIRDRHPLPTGQNLIVVLDRMENGKCNRCFPGTDLLVKRLGEKYPGRVKRWVAGGTTLKEQMGVLSQAKVFIAPHGSGLTNMIFLPDDALVIEITNHPLNFNYCFFDMASSLGLKYQAVVGDVHRIMSVV